MPIKAIIKPAPGAFSKLLAQQHLNPSETLFIDDNPGHLNGAQQAGLFTLLYTEGLRFDYVPMYIYRLDEKERKAFAEARNTSRARL